MYRECDHVSGIDALGNLPRTLSWFGHGCSGERMCWCHDCYHALSLIRLPGPDLFVSDFGLLLFVLAVHAFVYFTHSILSALIFVVFVLLLLLLVVVVVVAAVVVVVVVVVVVLLLLLLLCLFYGMVSYIQNINY